MGRLHNTYAIFRSETALLEKAVVLTPPKAKQPSLQFGRDHNMKVQLWLLASQNNNMNDIEKSLLNIMNKPKLIESIMTAAK